MDLLTISGPGPSCDLRPSQANQPSDPVVQGGREGGARDAAHHFPTTLGKS